MANEKKVVTGLGKPEIHRVLIRGYDLTKDLVGKITFADMTYLMLVGRFPNDGERRMTDALLTILVEHGMVSSVVSARLCYSTAPEALQAAVASSILGPSVHLGSSNGRQKCLSKFFGRQLPADLTHRGIGGGTARQKEKKNSGDRP
jgi:citrate synthase